MKSTLTTKHHDVADQPKAQAQNFLKKQYLLNSQVEWSDGENLTPRGGVMYFSHFLSENGQFEALVDQFPLTYQSNNAPSKR